MWKCRVVDVDCLKRKLVRENRQCGVVMRKAWRDRDCGDAKIVVIGKIDTNGRDG
jgi:hypothetical protein